MLVETDRKRNRMTPKPMTHRFEPYPALTFTMLTDVAAGHLVVDGPVQLCFLLDRHEASLDSLHKILAVLQRLINVPSIGAQKVVGSLLVSAVASVFKVGHDPEQQNLLFRVEGVARLLRTRWLFPLGVLGCG